VLDIGVLLILALVVLSEVFAVSETAPASVRKACLVAEATTDGEHAGMIHGAGHWATTRVMLTNKRQLTAQLAVLGR